MTLNEWKDDLLNKAIRQITYRNNMSQADKNDLVLVLSDYLSEGINILRKWRKLKTDDEFVSGMHDAGLIVFIKAKDQANGRDLFGSYSSGGVSSTMKLSPESMLKASCKQVI
jgi:hypothetical protein